MKFVAFCGDGNVLVEFDNLKDPTTGNVIRRTLPIKVFRQALRALSNVRMKKNVQFVKNILAVDTN